MRHHAQRHFDAVPTFDGALAVSGVLEAAAGHTLLTALAAHSKKAGAEDDRTPTQRRADALLALAEQHLEVGDLPDVHGERPRVVVTMTLEQLLAADGVGTLTLQGGTAITPATARMMACDAEFLPIVLSGDSEVLDAGRTRRAWSTAQRRAAAARSGGICEVPGCQNRATVLHHIIWWVHGGRTGLDNSAHICGHHHWLVHHSAWDVAWNKGTLRFFHTPGATRLERGAKIPFAGDGAPWTHPPDPPESRDPEASGDHDAARDHEPPGDTADPADPAAQERGRAVPGLGPSASTPDQGG